MDIPVKTFTPNENHVAFLNALKENGGAATLFELNYFKGYNFKPGAINTLKAHGYVTVEDGEGYDCEVVYNGVVVGHTHKPAKVYKLTGKAY
jgi:hypothetical protein